jgi:hypothetical protein
MISFFRDLFKGINSSDGLESTMSLMILCILIPIVMLVIGLLYKMIIFII